MNAAETAIRVAIRLHDLTGDTSLFGKGCNTLDDLIHGVQESLRLLKDLHDKGARWKRVSDALTITVPLEVTPEVLKDVNSNEAFKECLMRYYKSITADQWLPSVESFQADEDKNVFRLTLKF